MKKALLLSTFFLLPFCIFSEHPTISIFTSIDNLFINDSNIHNEPMPQAIKDDIGDGALIGHMRFTNKDIEWRIELSFQDHFSYGAQFTLGKGKVDTNTENYHLDVYFSDYLEFYGLYFLSPDNRGMYFGLGAFSGIIEAKDEDTTEQYFRDFSDIELKIGFRENWGIGDKGYITVGFEGTFMPMTQSSRYGILSGIAF